jgi:hypothetical protein
MQSCMMFFRKRLYLRFVVVELVARIGRRADFKRHGYTRLSMQ